MRDLRGKMLGSVSSTKGNRTMTPISMELGKNASRKGGAESEQRLRLIVPVGRRCRGTTFWSSWFVDRRMRDNENLIVGEGDYIKSMRRTHR